MGAAIPVHTAECDGSGQWKVNPNMDLTPEMLTARFIGRIVPKTRCDPASYLVTDETPARSEVQVVVNDEVASAVLDAASEKDLI